MWQSVFGVELLTPESLSCDLISNVTIINKLMRSMLNSYRKDYNRLLFTRHKGAENPTRLIDGKEALWYTNENSGNL